MGNYVILRTGTKGIKNECLLVDCWEGFFIEKLIYLNIVTREMSRLLMLSGQQVIFYRQKMIFLYYDHPQIFMYPHDFKSYCSNNFI